MENEITEQDLIMRNHYDSILAKIRADNAYWSVIVQNAASMYGHPKLKNTIIEMPPLLKKLHQEISECRAFLDKILKSKGVCVCENCQLHNSDIQKRRECFGSIQQSTYTPPQSFIQNVKLGIKETFDN